jgi:succinate dehydrogenase/fumarate reductase flavoprotein subunit
VNRPSVKCVYDVVVVGGGGSGLAAAVEAAAHGVQVLVLEVGSVLRGSTGMSVGSIAAAGTHEQRRAGITDSAEGHLHDYRVLSGILADTEDPALVRLLVDNVPRTVEWLREMGVEFFGPVIEPPHSVPRLINALPGSRSYVYHLARRAVQLGVDIALGHRAERLILESGRVTGVATVLGDGQRASFSARRGVVLASGDFSASADLKRSWISEAVAEFQPVNPYALGDAQRMTAPLGGTVLNAEVLDKPSMRLVPPGSEGLYGLLQRLPPRRFVTLPIKWGLERLPERLVRPLMMGFVTTYLSPREVLMDDGGILVDLRGQLQSDNDEDINLTVASLGLEGGYIIGDRNLSDRYSRDPHWVATAPGLAHAYMPDFRRGRRDAFREADSLSALAEKLGVASATLSASVAKANELAQRYGKPILETPPYFSLGPVRGYLLQTNGGLKITERLEVVGADAAPIPGLYAVGNAGQGGLLLFGHGHHLGWAFTSGRLAGQIVASADPETSEAADEQVASQQAPTTRRAAQTVTNNPR